MFYHHHVEFIFADVDDAKNDKSSNSDEVESLKKALSVEKTLKTQAVNKLAEIIQRKDISSNKGKSKANSQDVKKKEKENKKLIMELREVKKNFRFLLVLNIRGNSFKVHNFVKRYSVIIHFRFIVIKILSFDVAFLLTKTLSCLFYQQEKNKYQQFTTKYQTQKYEYEMVSHTIYIFVHNYISTQL